MSRACRHKHLTAFDARPAVSTPTPTPIHLPVKPPRCRALASHTHMHVHRRRRWRKVRTRHVTYHWHEPSAGTGTWNVSFPSRVPVLRRCTVPLPRPPARAQGNLKSTEHRKPAILRGVRVRRQCTSGTRAARAWGGSGRGASLCHAHASSSAYQVHSFVLYPLARPLEHTQRSSPHPHGQ